MKDYKTMPRGPEEKFHTADDAGKLQCTVVASFAMSFLLRSGLQGFLIRYFFYVAWHRNMFARAMQTGMTADLGHDWP